MNNEKIYAELVRLRDYLGSGDPRHATAIHAAQQALSWALDPRCAASPYDAILNIRRDFEPGDGVKLNSGGPHMKVVSVEGDDLVAEWESDDGPQSASFPKAAVKRHEPPSDQPPTASGEEKTA